MHHHVLVLLGSEQLAVHTILLVVNDFVVSHLVEDSDKVRNGILLHVLASRSIERRVLRQVKLPGAVSAEDCFTVRMAVHQVVKLCKRALDARIDLALTLQALVDTFKK